MRAGIAIVSAFGRLKKSLSNSERHIHIGKVRYVDYRASSIDSGNGFNAVMHKKLEYEHEREIRAAILDASDLEGVFFDAVGREVPSTAGWARAGWRRKESAAKGISVPVSVEELVELIYVSPLADDWFLDLVRAVVKRYELNVEVRRSDLHAVPT